VATNSKKKYWEGVGRRKTSTARVRIYEGKSASMINGKPVEEVYTVASEQDRIYEPLIVTGTKTKLYFTAKSFGGGVNGQKDAIVLGSARAIEKFDESQGKVLRDHDLMTRDPRKKERKEYFHLKSRKKPQFSKR
jgi:small subunit ribosomal protein S9